jgi:RNase P subunit RPR2
MVEAVHVFCPNCQGAMTQALREHVLFTRDFFKLSFVCQNCGNIEKRIIDEREPYHPQTHVGTHRLPRHPESR